MISPGSGTSLSRARQVRQTYDYEADGGLYAWGIAYALQIVPQLSFGITFNIWQDGIYQNEWESEATTKAFVNPFGDEWWEFNTVQKDHYSFSGFNVNLGMLVEYHGPADFGGGIQIPVHRRLGA